MIIFRVVLAVAWLVVAYVTIQAVLALGVSGANIFIDDFAQPWRAQFNTDFSFHILLVVAWILYREGKLLIGIPCAIGAAMLGGFFTLAYILVATFRAKGDMRKLLLGDRS